MTIPAEMIVNMAKIRRLFWLYTVSLVADMPIRNKLTFFTPLIIIKKLYEVYRFRLSRGNVTEIP